MNIDRGTNHNNIILLLSEAVNAQNGAEFTALDILSFFETKGVVVTKATIQKHLNHRAKQHLRLPTWENGLLKNKSKYKKAN